MGGRVRSFDPGQIDLGTLRDVFPVEEIDKILREADRAGKRKRQLPGNFTCYLVIALGLWMTDGCGEVLRRLLEGARRTCHDIRIASGSAITQARQRVGGEVMEKIYRHLVRPIALKTTRSAWYRRWRLVTLDGTTMDVADSDENVTEFGRPSNQHGGGAYPQLRCVALVENGTHSVFAAEMGPCTTAEGTLADKVLQQLESTMLCLADRLFYSYKRWKTLQECGAALLWRMRSQIALPRIKTLPDGSYLSKVYPSAEHRRRDKEGITVRVIEYWVDGFRQLYRIMTNVLDPAQGPAEQFARLYGRRWTIETAFGEIKTKLRSSRIVLRSKKPELVRQDFFGLLLAHFGVRSLMHRAALQEDIPADELSFVHSLRVIERKLPLLVSFSPSPDPTPA